ncbi:hypothetical protein [Persephonella sp. KM09-Lau-8]|uniref:hypothetical protein n=1 Tax=Persephonella sp. KM09-Lau-8 TaxID=1158345 RepID=UPI000497DF91|nr:hypothetical protein [Persephonella sp. KM09-Lau-8]
MNQKNFKKVGISVSEPPDEDLKKNGLTIYHLRDFIIELTRFLISNNTQIIYGGALDYNLGKINFTQVLIELAENYYVGYSKQQENIPIPLLINFSAYPYCKPIKENEVNLKAKFKIEDDKYLVNFKFFPENCKGIDVDSEKCKYLSEMRKAMSEYEDARVLAGGKLEGSSCKYSGILEEALYAIQNKKPLFLVGTFGGATKKIIELLEDKENEFVDKEINGLKVREIIKPDLLSNNKLNPLSFEENKKLFQSKNIHELVFLIIKGIKNL